MLLSFQCARPEGDRAAEEGRGSPFLAAFFKSLNPAIHLKVFIYQSAPRPHPSLDEGGPSCGGILHSFMRRHP